MIVAEEYADRLPPAGTRGLRDGAVESDFNQARSLQQNLKQTSQEIAAPQSFSILIKDRERLYENKKQ